MWDRVLVGRPFDLIDSFLKKLCLRVAFVELINLQLTALILIILFFFMYRFNWGGGRTLNKFLKN